MKVNKTVRIEMTDKEKEALRIVYRMLYDLEWEDEKAVADELDYDDLEPIRTDLAKLYDLGGGTIEAL